MNFKDLRRAARYAAGRRFLEATLRLPEGISRPLYAGLGEACFLLVGRDRRLALDNLRHAYPDLSPGAVRSRARAVFRRLTGNIHDVGRAPSWSGVERAARLEVRGLDRLEAATAGGRGVILFGGHQGAWELVAPALARHGVRLTTVARPIREKRLESWLAEHRAALGIATLPQGPLASAREARRVLGRGEALGILLDHRIRRGGVVCDFFGRPARFSAGPARLAIRTGAPMLPVGIVRDGGRHVVTIGAPLAAPSASADGRDRAAVLVRAAVTELERRIREAPEEWAWIHPRWEGPDPAPARRRLVARESLVLLAAVGAALFASCESSKNTSVSVADSGGPSSAMADFKVRETVSGRLKWILYADSAETYDETRETLVKNLKVDFYDPEGAISSVLHADHGVLHSANNDLTGRGHVRIESTAGDTLTTEQLDWDNQASRIRTKEPFRLARPGGWITGTGFESDPDLRNYTTEDVRIDARAGSEGGGDE